MEKKTKFSAARNPARSDWSTPARVEVPDSDFGVFSLGRALRTQRKRANLTLAEVSARLNVSVSQLSLFENGKREPKVTVLRKLADLYGVGLDDLTRTTHDRRASLEIELERAMRSPLATGIPTVKLSPAIPVDALESLVALHRELKRQADERIATPEEARQANTQLRAEMRAANNYFPELEAMAEDLLTTVGYQRGPLSSHLVGDIAAHLGFTLEHVADLPHSTRSVIDLKHRRIYLSDSTSHSDLDQRSILLQTLGHHLLGHQVPDSYGEFLRQRIETNYLAAALLLPRQRTVDLMQAAKAAKDLAVEDLRDAFAVSYESAAHRMTNLITEFCDITIHFQKVHSSGTIYKAYENDGVLFPADHNGAIEGQPVCRFWTSREVFDVADKFNAFNQYTDTPRGTYWCSARVERDFSLSIGVPYAQAKWFRGRDTVERSVSRCPDPTCCRLPPPDLQSAWQGNAWPTANTRAHLLAALPPGAFPGVDETEVYAFLARHDR